ncbi:TetR/AcrR family transcriptional regulator [uncultured Williamsia sp.]|uniref:TetR/AcrR family transcriptional regulator n=1 Tax=uncultured Williamsia sp. TaxID=259311 RepID=UPI00262BB639|nr:TetR/AcrR family transcriptional regulator [uncultured Williamsia sp.]
MASTDRRARERAERHHRIVTSARDLAEADGWAAVTTRRLADEIEYTPPVLYQHFPDGRDGVVTAVAVLGFEEFTVTARAAVDGGGDPLVALVDAYLAFARAHPATYEAMFSLAVGVPFASESTPAALTAAFDVIVDAIGPDRDDAGVRAELLWSTLHGLCELERHSRLDPQQADARRALAITQAR